MKIAHDETGDVIAAPAALLQKDAVQNRRRIDCDMGFFGKLAGKSIRQGLARFDAAAGKIPAVDISVAHQQDAVFGIEDDPAHAEADRLRQALADPLASLPPSFVVKREPDGIPPRRIEFRMNQIYCLARASLLEPFETEEIIR